MALMLSVAACGDDDSRPMLLDSDGGVLDDGGPRPDVPTATPDMPPATAGDPGSACNCDSDCIGDATHPGLCVGGVCMTRSAGDCATAGSATECAAGSRCWGLQGVEGGICWPDCSAHTCAGTCDSDGSCVASEGMSCDAACGSVCGDGGNTDNCPPNSHMQGDDCVCDDGFMVNADRTACVGPCMVDIDCGGGGLMCIDSVCRTPPCTPASCGDGLLCADSGDCVIDIGTPPPGPVPACAAGMGMVPDWQCTTGCADIVPFEPDVGPGWWDYPLNGESEADQYRSYIRRDVMMLIKYATAMVACQTGAWTFGNGGNLGLGDMSEANGDIPGTRTGQPGHPRGTHVNGHDMDIAYYQVNTPDNRLRPVCEYRTGGASQEHCTGAPTLLDPWRTALFIGHLHINPNLRVIGVDGRVGPPVQSALTQLCSSGWVTTGCGPNQMTYEETDMGRGWFRFHHHHLHVSVSG